jgi:hypothetical protein
MVYATIVGGKLASPPPSKRLLTIGPAGGPDGAPAAGAAGTRTFGPWRSSTVRTSQGFALHEVVARRIVTGSTHAWVVDYRYACGRPAPCWGREFVTHDAWLTLRPGDHVDIRRVADGFGGVRFEERARWPDALIEMLLGALMLLAAKATAAIGPLTLPKQAARGEAAAWPDA